MSEEETQETEDTLETEETREPPVKYAVASRHVGTERRKVRWMYREPPGEETDSGWRFFSGDEEEDFGADPDNFEYHALSTIGEIDPSILPYLEREPPCAFERDTGDAPFTEVADFALPAAEEGPG